ncbi:MAG: 4'-phosphopantetheinyl transferase superfamily protein [Nitrospira sp.]|nr:4'-phosphopantetheinyl transferase superfamily protein [Nitrospira sp.]
MRIIFQPIECLTVTHRQDNIQLEPKAIHLWGITLDGSSHSLKRCGEWLDERERERAARLVREQDRTHFVLSHGGLRAILSRYLNVGPDSIRFDRSPSGKPMLAKKWRDRSSITFNLSHAHGRALVAVSRAQEIGIDLELVRSDIQVEQLSRRFFTPLEHRAVLQSAAEQRIAVFFRYWVAKEAVLKAQGIGLRGLAGCEITLEADHGGKAMHVRVDSNPLDRMNVQLLVCDNGWEAAVAAQNLDQVKPCGPNLT